MIKQMKYFQAVVRHKSFTKAAEECFISQSAISQQIQSLERDLNVKLLKRENRTVELTPAGEFFYKRSLILVNEFERICEETACIANGGKKEFTIGYLKNYLGTELKETVCEFRENFSDVQISFITGTHEDLYHELRNGNADMVISDLRRTPSSRYVNYFLARGYVYAELPVQNSLTQLESLNVDDLKGIPCILVAHREQSYNEELFYREYFGLKSDFILADSLEEAHLMVVSGRGYMLMDFSKPPESNSIVKYIPIRNQEKPVCRKYYAFWRVENTKKYPEVFAGILKKCFPDKTEDSKSYRENAG